MEHLKELPFTEVLHETFEALKDVTEMVLSTSSNGHVTSRVVSTACYGPRVVFLSWGHHTKCIQIRNNPSIALCHNNYQIEGTAVIRGDVIDPLNSQYADLYKAKQALYYEMFSGFQGMQVIEIEINKISCFGFEGMTFYIDRIDIANETAYRENLEQPAI